MIAVFNLGQIDQRAFCKLYEQCSFCTTVSMFQHPKGLQGQMISHHIIKFAENQHRLSNLRSMHVAFKTFPTIAKAFLFEEALCKNHQKPNECRRTYRTVSKSKIESNRVEQAMAINLIGIASNLLGPPTYWFKLNRYLA